MCVMEWHENHYFYFSSCGLVLTSVKEQFLFSINIFESNQNNKKRYDEQNTPISESHPKTLDCGLKAYLKSQAACPVCL